MLAVALARALLGGGGGAGPDPLPTLTIVRAGSAERGAVTSTVGIACGVPGASEVCSVEVTAGATVTVTRSVPEAVVFTGWSGGGCAGTGDCVLTITEDTTVTATFDDKRERKEIPLVLNRDLDLGRPQ